MPSVAAVGIFSDSEKSYNTSYLILISLYCFLWKNWSLSPQTSAFDCDLVSDNFCSCTFPSSQCLKPNITGISSVLCIKSRSLLQILLRWPCAVDGMLEPLTNHSTVTETNANEVKKLLHQKLLRIYDSYRQIREFYFPLKHHFESFHLQTHPLCNQPANRPNRYRSMCLMFAE